MRKTGDCLVQAQTEQESLQQTIKELESVLSHLRDLIQWRRQNQFLTEGGSPSPAPREGPPVPAVLIKPVDGYARPIPAKGLR